MTTKATITYLLSEEGRKKSLLQGGSGKREQNLEADITPELLTLAHVSSEGNIKLRIGDDSSYSLLNHRDCELYVDKYSGKPEIRPLSGNNTGLIAEIITFDAPQTADALIDFETNRRTNLETRQGELQPEFDRLMEEYNVKQAAEKARNEVEEAKRKAEREVEEAAKKVERERLEADKLQWIQQHGDDYLRDAVALGYDCQREYVAQRTDMEFPGYVVDFDNNAVWKSRSCPSREALAEVKGLIAKGYQAEVVWLTCPPWELDEFEAGEAVVIRSYLGKYDLVKTV